MKKLWLTLITWPLTRRLRVSKWLTLIILLPLGYLLTTDNLRVMTGYLIMSAFVFLAISEEIARARIRE